MAGIQKITPFLWFDTQAEDAMNFYVSVFDDSRVVDVTRYGKAGPGREGSVMTVTFELAGQRFTGLNGGPQHPFTEAISFTVHCGSQDEVDRLWDRLTADGGEPIACGWLKDRFGLRWQITPDALVELLSDPDAAKSARVMTAMMSMVKIDIAALQKAAAG